MPCHLYPSSSYAGVLSSTLSFREDCEGDTVPQHLVRARYSQASFSIGTVLGCGLREAWGGATRAEIFLLLSSLQRCSEQENAGLNRLISILRGPKITFFSFIS
jgi:hypothetical protein